MNEKELKMVLEVNDKTFLLKDVNQALEAVNAQKDWKYHLKGIFNIAFLGLPDFLGMFDAYWTMDRKLYDTHLSKYEPLLREQYNKINTDIKMNSDAFAQSVKKQLNDFIVSNDFITRGSTHDQITVVDANKNARLDKLSLQGEPGYDAVNNDTQNMLFSANFSKYNVSGFSGPNDDFVSLELLNKQPKQKDVHDIVGMLNKKFDEINSDFSPMHTQFIKLDIEKDQTKRTLAEVVAHKW